MSAKFASSGSPYLSYNDGFSLDLISEGLTLACWFKTADTTPSASLCLVWAGRLQQTSEFAAIFINTVGDIRGFIHQHGGGATLSADSTTAVPATDTWYPCIATFDDQNIAVFFQGNKNTNSDTRSRSTGGYNRVALGRAMDSSASNSHLDGHLAHACAWDTILSDDECWAFLAGWDPQYIRPQNLTFYAPLFESRQLLWDHPASTGIVGTTFELSDNPPVAGMNTPIIGRASVDDGSETGTVSEGLGLSDAHSALAGALGSIADTLGLSDAFDATQSGAETGSLSETLELADTEAATAAALATLAEEIGLGDAWDAIKTTPSGAAVAEGLGLDDAYTAVASALAAISEELGLDDTVSGLAATSAAIAETLGIADVFDGEKNKIVDEEVPPDDDADTTVTIYMDKDGNALIAPRVTIMHAMDSLLNTDLVEPQRLALDAFEAKSVRVGSSTGQNNRTQGRTVRLYWYTNRGGHAMGMRRVIIEVDDAGKEPMRAKVT